MNWHKKIDKTQKYYSNHKILFFNNKLIFIIGLTIGVFIRFNFQLIATKLIVKTNKIDNSSEKILFNNLNCIGNSQISNFIYSQDNILMLFSNCKKEIKKKLSSRFTHLFEHFESFTLDKNNDYSGNTNKYQQKYLTPGRMKLRQRQN